MPAIFKTSETLWYHNGVWGDMGYAVPNFGVNASSMNAGIRYLTAAIGRNLSGIVHCPDADLRSPPSIDCLTNIHKLICRARQILGARGVPPGQATMQLAHVAPASEDHLVFPVPYFLMRNQWIKEYTGYILAALAEAMQHTENRMPFTFSTNFAVDITQLFQKVYVQMAMELLGIDQKTANDPNFVITTAQLAAYNPNNFFTSTEMIDNTAPAVSIPTGLDLQVLTNGIPASKLVNLALWPDGTPYNPMAPSAVDAAGDVAGSTAGTTASGSATPATNAVPPFATQSTVPSAAAASPTQPTS